MPPDRTCTPTIGYLIFMTKQKPLSGLLFTAKILHKAMYHCTFIAFSYLGQSSDKI